MTDKRFTSALIRLAIPIMAQQCMAALMTMLGNMMIGGLGDNALAALLQATQVSFLLLVFMFGISSTTQAFVAQHWGQADLCSIRKTLGFSIVCGQVIGWGFFLVSFFCPGTVLSLFTKDPVVHAMGVQYLRIAGFGFPMLGLTNVYAAVLRGTENVRLPMTTSIAGLCCNGLFNYLLIYGHWGLPALGIQGAAIAALAAQLVDMSLLLLFSRLLKKPTANGQYPLFYLAYKA